PECADDVERVDLAPCEPSAHVVSELRLRERRQKDDALAALLALVKDLAHLENARRERDLPFHSADLERFAIGPLGGIDRDDARRRRGAIVGVFSGTLDDLAEVCDARPNAHSGFGSFAKSFQEISRREPGRESSFFCSSTARDSSSRLARTVLCPSWMKGAGEETETALVSVLASVPEAAP